MKSVRLIFLTLLFSLFVHPLCAQGNIDWEEMWRHARPPGQQYFPMPWMNGPLAFTGLAYDETRDVVYVVSPHLVAQGSVLWSEPRIFVLDADSGGVRTDLGRSAHPSRMGLGGELPVPIDTMNAPLGAHLGFGRNKFVLYKIDVDEEGRIYACNLVNPLWGYCKQSSPGIGPCDPDYLDQGPFRVWRWDTPTSTPELIYATLNTNADAIGDRNSSEMNTARWGDAFAVTGKRGWYTPPGGQPVQRDSVRIYVSGGQWDANSGFNPEISVLVEDRRPVAARPDRDVMGAGKLSFRLGVTIQLPLVGSAAHGIAPARPRLSQGDLYCDLWINKNGGPVTRIEEFQSGTQSLPQTYQVNTANMQSLSTTLTGPAGPLSWFDMAPWFPGRNYLSMADAVPTHIPPPVQPNANTTSRIVDVVNGRRVWSATPRFGSNNHQTIGPNNFVADIDMRMEQYTPPQNPGITILHINHFVLMSDNGIAAFRGRDDIIVPVELSAFNARRVESGVELRWRVESEQQSLLFRVLRSDMRDGAYRQIGTVASRGTTNEAAWYEFMDRFSAGMPATGTLWYRLEEVATDGTTERFPAVSVELGRSSAAWRMTVFPRPLAAGARSVSLRWESPTEQMVTLHIHDLLGRRVGTPLTRMLPAGGSVLTIPLPDLIPGQYMLEARAAHGPPLRSRIVVR